MNKKTIIIIGVILIVLCLCFCVLGIVSMALLDSDVLSDFNAWVDDAQSENSESFLNEDEDTNDSAGINDNDYVFDSSVNAPQVAYEELLDEIVPQVSLSDVAVRLGILEIAPTIPQTPIKQYVAGDSRDFIVSGDDEDFTITATLEKITPHSYIWVEDGLWYDIVDMEKFAGEFENKIYPLNQRLFGSEWSPGIDGDPHIVILYVKDVGVDTAGYYSADDEEHVSLSETSNMAEMFVLNANVTTLAEEYTLGTLAHEYQHMIHWNADGNESIWLDEGFAELAAFLGGYEMDGSDYEFLRTPDFQLNTWDDDNPTKNYGASFSFINYIYNRLGEDIIKMIVQNSHNGFNSIDDVLEKMNVSDVTRGEGLTADAIVQDWMIANYVLDDSVLDGRFAYANYPNAPKVNVRKTLYPEKDYSYDFSVHQYGADYVNINAKNGFDLHFDGSDLIPLLPTAIKDGNFAFWSHSNSQSDMKLTGLFDFTNVSGSLTLTFDTWYDIEEDYDFAYLLYSEDGGANWNSLATEKGVYSKYSNSYAWTGSSHHWVQEKADLSSLAGKKILLRFEYITDSTTDYSGILIDNLRIDEIGYHTSFESKDLQWAGEGFVRVNHLLPQIFSVAAIIDYGDEKMVEYLTLDEANQLDYSIESNVAENVIFVISGATRFVFEKASYEIRFK